MTRTDLIRPTVESVDDGMDWLERRGWPANGVETEDGRRCTFKRFRFARWRVDHGTMTDAAPPAPPIEEDEDDAPKGIGLAVVGTGVIFWLVLIAGIFLP